MDASSTRRIQLRSDWFIVILASFVVLTLIVAVIALSNGPTSTWSALTQDDSVELIAAINRTPNSLESKDKLGQTLFLRAVANNKLACVRALIDRGADIHARWQCKRDWNQAYHWNALHVAAANGHQEIAKLLINAGVNMNEKCEDGQTPLDLAIERRNPGVAELLRAKGGKQGQDLP